MPACKGMPHYNHGPRIHEYLSEFKHDVLDHYDCFTLAEAPMVTPKRALTYIDEKDGQLDMMIQFQCVAADCLFTDYLPMKFSLRRMKKAFSSWQEKLRGRGWNSLYIETTTIPESFPATEARNSGRRAPNVLPPCTCSSRGHPSSIRGRRSA